MSKASKWVAMSKETVWQETVEDDGDDPIVLCVGESGDLVFSEWPGDESSDRLSPREALRLARWIIDTFDDAAEQSSPPPPKAGEAGEQE